MKQWSIKIAAGWIALSVVGMSLVGQNSAFGVENGADTPSRTSAQNESGVKGVDCLDLVEFLKAQEGKDQITWYSRDGFQDILNQSDLTPVSTVDLLAMHTQPYTIVLNELYKSSGGFSKTLEQEQIGCDRIVTRLESNFQYGDEEKKQFTLVQEIVEYGPDFLVLKNEVMGDPTRPYIMKVVKVGENALDETYPRDFAIGENGTSGFFSCAGEPIPEFSFQSTSRRTWGDLGSEVQVERSSEAEIAVRTFELLQRSLGEYRNKMHESKGLNGYGYRNGEITSLNPVNGCAGKELKQKTGGSRVGGSSCDGCNHDEDDNIGEGRDAL